MYFYYAYLIDGSKNGGTPAKIATGCASTMKLGAGRMGNFNQFVGFINNLGRPVSVTNDAMPDIDRTAKALVDQRLTGEYDILKIMDLKERSIPLLFQEVANFVKGNLDAASKSQLAGARTAIQRVSFYRKQANLDAMQAMLEKNWPRGINIRKNTAAPYSGAEAVEIMNIQATIKANPANMDIQEFIDNEMSKDPSHNDNVKAAAQAMYQMCKR